MYYVIFGYTTLVLCNVFLIRNKVFGVIYLSFNVGLYFSGYIHTRCKSGFDAYYYAMQTWEFLKVVFPETRQREFGS